MAADCRMSSREKYALALVAISCSALSACATSSHGWRQQIAISSTPPGAEVTVNGISAGTTPARASVRRDEDSVVVRIVKEGYKPAEATLRRRVMGWWWIPGDILLGAGLGAGAALLPGSGIPENQRVSAMLTYVVLALGFDVFAGAIYKQIPDGVNVVLVRASTSPPNP